MFVPVGLMRTSVEPGDRPRRCAVAVTDLQREAGEAEQPVAALVEIGKVLDVDDVAGLEQSVVSAKRLIVHRIEADDVEPYALVVPLDDEVQDLVVDAGVPHFESHPVLNSRNSA